VGDKSDAYNPHGKTAAMLARAFELVQSVPYRVTARWLFYQLLQEGYYRDKKKDYKDKFLKTLSAARHRLYGGWRPDTLVDDRRDPIIRGEGYDDPTEWVNAVARGAQCNLSRWTGQSYYVELWFEAEAMVRQFEYYTQGITLRPFSGMPSIAYKWDIAKALERAAERYGLPIVVLYFGDLDKAGHTIPETSIGDIREWCSVDFDVVRGGLNPGDERRFNLPENPDKPGAYQWEALADAAARELIVGTMERFIDFGVKAQIESQEAEATERIRAELATVAERWAE